MMTYVSRPFLTLIMQQAVSSEWLMQMVTPNWSAPADRLVTQIPDEDIICEAYFPVSWDAQNSRVMAAVAEVRFPNVGNMAPEIGGCAVFAPQVGCMAVYIHSSMLKRAMQMTNEGDLVAKWNPTCPVVMQL